MIELKTQMFGMQELEKQLLNMERNVARKLVKSSLKTALEPMLTKEKANAASMIGGKMGSDIARMLAIEPMTIKRRFTYGIRTLVRPLHSFIHITKKGVRHYIPSAIEYGHAAPYATSGKKGENLKEARKNKTVPAIPALRTAVDSTWRTVLRIFEREVIIAVDEAVKNEDKP